MTCIKFRTHVKLYVYKYVLDIKLYLLRSKVILNKFELWFIILQLIDREVPTVQFNSIQQSLEKKLKLFFVILIFF